LAKIEHVNFHTHPMRYYLSFSILKILTGTKKYEKINLTKLSGSLRRNKKARKNNEEKEKNKMAFENQ